MITAITHGTEDAKINYIRQKFKKKKLTVMQKNKHKQCSKMTIENLTRTKLEELYLENLITEFSRI